MPITLTGDFSNYNFGNVGIGQTASFSRNINETGDPTPDGANWLVTLNGDAAFSVTFQTGFSSEHPLNPGFFTIQFAPTGAGLKSTILTISSADATNTPIQFTISGTGSAAGFLTLSPQTTNDFGPVKDGMPSSPLNVMVANNSGADVVVTAIAFNGDFTAGPGQPAVPFTLHANGADPPIAISVIFTPSVTGFRVTANALVVTSSATNSPTSQSMQGTGFIITAVFTVPARPQAVLMAFVTGTTVVILRMDPTNLDTEESASFKRVYDWGSPLMEKYLGRVILRYEDESAVPFDFIVTGVAPRLPSPVIVSVINQGGLNDGLIHNAFADLQISDDLVQVQVSRDALDGPLVITEIFHEVDKRGEVIEGA